MHPLSPTPLRDWLIGSLLALGVLAAPVRGQPVVPGKEAPATSALALPTDRKVQQVLNKCVELIDERDWEGAAKLLQAVLDQPQDCFVQSEQMVAGKQIARQVSAKAEVNRLLAGLPADGKKAYLKLHSADAEQRLNQAKQLSDPELLADIAVRYLHTPSGPEALLLLGNRALSRDEPLLAALYFERRLQLPDADKVAPLNLYRMALAFYRAGDKPLGDRVWKQLTETVKQDGGLKVGKEFYNLEQLRKLFDRAFGEDLRPLMEWPLFRGGPRRTEPATGGTPLLDPAWSASTLTEHPASKAWTENNLNNALRFLQVQRGEPILPAFFPIASRGRLYFRGYDAVYSLSAKQAGKLTWYAPPDGGVHALLHNPNTKAMLEQWEATYRQFGPHSALFDNSVLGCLSTDGDRVFVVDDLALSPHPHLLRNFMWGGVPNFGALTDQVNANSLKSYNGETGKLMWELGGRFDKQSDLEGGHFLGAPLPVAGRIYFLHEKKSELRLVCVQPQDTITAAVPPDVMWVQTLATMRDKIQFDYLRRTHAAHLAYADGILICPTNAGAVFGVDLLTHSLVWAYMYREAEAPKAPANPPFGPAGMPAALPVAEWRTAAPAIHEHKVLFTAPDANALHCIDLRNGTLLWKAKREPGDLYFAGVVAGQALIVGKNYCRALSVGKGEPTWRLEDVGVPSGQGTASGLLYYLPLFRGPDKQPEICVLDVAQGKIVARVKSRKQEVPGNLIFAEGMLYSQTLKGIAAYPLVQVKLNRIDEQLKKNPKDAAGLLERGELHLNQGELERAYDDLHAGLANRPSADLAARGRERLHEALGELLQRDFAKYEKHLEEFKSLGTADDPDVQRRRQSQYFVVVGQGRAGQGRLTDALQAYREFAALANEQELLAVPGEPNVKATPGAWLAGRVAALLARATPEQRRALEAQATEQLKASQGKKDLDDLRRFVGLFGRDFPAGRQGQLLLAERLLAAARDPKADELREAQLLLLQLRGQKRTDEASAGRAVEALARLMVQKGLFEDAVHYYRELNRDFAKTVIKDGKTGAELFKEVQADKRLLPYLKEPKAAWQGQFKVTEVAGAFPAHPTLTVEPRGDVPPFLQQHRLALDLNASRLFVTNLAAGQQTWATPTVASLAYLSQAQPSPRLTFSPLGYLGILQLGHLVFGMDPVEGKKLWEYNLFAPQTDTAPQVAQILRNRDGDLVLLSQDGWVQKLGSVLATADHVAVLTRQGLTLLDPGTGRVRWTRENVSSGAALFGDRDHLFLVERQPDGKVASSRALRTVDGAVVRTPDFGEVYQGRQAILDGMLLAKDDLPQGGSRLRLYDVLTGQDRWQKDFAAKSIIVQSETADLTGVLEPDGALHLLDARTGTEKLQAKLPKEGLDKLQEVRLLLDREHYFVILNQSADGAVWPNVQPTLPSLRVNGSIHAFDRASGKQLWVTAISQQMLLLEQHQDLPLLLFATRVNKIAVQNSVVKSIQKTTGKLLCDKELVGSVNPFHSLQLDPQTGTIELVGFNLKIRHRLEAADKEKQ